MEYRYDDLYGSKPEMYCINIKLNGWKNYKRLLTFYDDEEEKAFKQYKALVKIILSKNLDFNGQINFDLEIAYANGNSDDYYVIKSTENE